MYFGHKRIEQKNNVQKNKKMSKHVTRASPTKPEKLPLIETKRTVPGLGTGNLQGKRNTPLVPEGTVAEISCG